MEIHFIYLIASHTRTKIRFNSLECFFSCYQNFVQFLWSKSVGCFCYSKSQKWITIVFCLFFHFARTHTHSENSGIFYWQEKNEFLWIYWWWWNNVEFFFCKFPHFVFMFDVCVCWLIIRAAQNSVIFLLLFFFLKMINVNCQKHMDKIEKDYEMKINR